MESVFIIHQHQMTQVVDWFEVCVSLSTMVIVKGDAVCGRSIKIVGDGHHQFPPVSNPSTHPQIQIQIQIETQIQIQDRSIKIPGDGQPHFPYQPAPLTLIYKYKYKYKFKYKFRYKFKYKAGALR